MDLSKYNVPKLPNALQVLEDLSAADTTKMELSSVAVDDETLQTAARCHQNFRQLKNDISSMNELNSILEDLNSKLLENIENMKSHNK